jgi:hypothetical protein
MARYSGGAHADRRAFRDEDGRPQDRASGGLTVVVGKPMRFPPKTPAEEITRQIEHVTWSM